MHSVLGLAWPILRENQVWFRTLFELLFLPPAGPLFLLGIGGVLLIVRRQLGWLLLVLGFGLTYASSIPAIVDPLALDWESLAPPIRTIPKNAQAIVVIGGGSRPSPAYGNHDTVTLLTLQRVRYVAYLAKRSGLPILVSGGRDWFGERQSEAELMARVLTEEYGLHVRWQDTRSRSTWGNARQTARILIPSGIRRVVLVTQAWHMPRALWSFRHVGFSPIAAPVGFVSQSWTQDGVLGWIPQARAVVTMAEITHEIVGMYWYRLRAWYAAND